MLEAASVAPYPKSIPIGNGSALLTFSPRQATSDCGCPVQCFSDRGGRVASCLIKTRLPEADLQRTEAINRQTVFPTSLVLETW